MIARPKTAKLVANEQPDSDRSLTWDQGAEMRLLGELGRDREVAAGGCPRCRGLARRSALPYPPMRVS